MTSHGFIFARGGSKGLPGKNIMPLAGKPLLQYSIEVASKIERLEKVFVSTDDAKIAALAQALGAIVIDRPAELAGDNSPEWLSWRHAVEWVESKFGDFTGFVSLPTTCPLRRVSDVNAAMDKLSLTNADICIAITLASRSPFFNMVKMTSDELVELLNRPASSIFRRQDAPDVFEVTTLVYATTPEFVMNHFSLFEGKVTSIEVPKARAVDIDDIYDFRLAEVILREQEI